MLCYKDMTCCPGKDCKLKNKCCRNQVYEEYWELKDEIFPICLMDPIIDKECELFLKIEK